MKKPIFQKVAQKIARTVKDNFLESAVWLASLYPANAPDIGKPNPSIFILRNNDLGDLLIITPLFEALRQGFPDSEIVAGVGSWNLETLKLNPYLSEVVEINAPWFNKFVPQQNLVQQINYLAFSPEIQRIAQRHFDLGIDIFGSSWGSLLLLRCGIPDRLGVRGYAGGHRALQQWVEYNPYEQVGRSALRFAELLGVKELPESRPQIFLSSKEKEQGEEYWLKLFEEQNKRIIIGPSARLLAKDWPLENYFELVRQLVEKIPVNVIIVGSKEEEAIGEQLAELGSNVKNLAGKLQLRETFAVVAAADLVICNSSMLMHASAAFAKQTLVLLGESFISQKQHDAQWGYPGTHYSLGKEEKQRTQIYSAPEVLNFIDKLLLGV